VLQIKNLGDAKDEGDSGKLNGKGKEEFNAEITGNAECTERKKRPTPPPRWIDGTLRGAQYGVSEWEFWIHTRQFSQERETKEISRVNVPVWWYDQ